MPPKATSAFSISSLALVADLALPDGRCWRVYQVYNSPFSSKASLSRRSKRPPPPRMPARPSPSVTHPPLAVRPDQPLNLIHEIARRQLSLFVVGESQHKRDPARGFQVADRVPCGSGLFLRGHLCREFRWPGAQKTRRCSAPRDGRRKPTPALYLFCHRNSPRQREIDRRKTDGRYRRRDHGAAADSLPDLANSLPGLKKFPCAGATNSLPPRRRECAASL
jgi:hypothetical protein